MLINFMKDFNLTKRHLLTLVYLFQFFVSGLASNLAFAEELKPIGTGAIIRVSPTYRIAFTTVDEKISVEDKANAIIELIERSPKNKIIYIVIEPNSNDNTYYKKLLSLIDNATIEARRTKGVQVRVQMVNYKLTAKIKDYLQAQNQKLDPSLLPSDNYVLKLQGSDVIFSEQDAPQDLVTAIKNESSLLRMALSPLRVVTSTVSSLKNLSVSGLAIATGLTALGMNSVGPSWVYVNDGVMSKEVIMSFALSTALLYSIPRNESLSREYYEIAYDFLRAPWQALRAVWIKNVQGRNVYLNPANPYVYTAFAAGAGIAGFSIPLQTAFYYLQDGNVSENLEFILKNAVLVGAASAPWSFFTEKLKSQTHLSDNLVTHLRTAQLAGIGVLLAGIPPHIGIDATFFDLNNMEEKMLLAMGGIGVAAIFKDIGIRLINKMDKNRFYRYFNANFQALTDATGNFFKRMVGLKPNDSEFMSMDEIIATITAEIEGLTEELQAEATNELLSTQTDQTLVLPSFASQRAGTCAQYLR